MACPWKDFAFIGNEATYHAIAGSACYAVARVYFKIKAKEFVYIGQNDTLYLVSAAFAYSIKRGNKILCFFVAPFLRSSTISNIHFARGSFQDITWRKPVSQVMLIVPMLTANSLFTT